MGVHAQALPAAVGGHHGEGAGLDGGAVGRQEDLAQQALVDEGVALVDGPGAGLQQGEEAGVDAGVGQGAVAVGGGQRGAVDARRGADARGAVGEVVLDRGQDGLRRRPVAVAEALDQRHGEARDQLGVLAVALVAAAPADVERDADGRGEAPAHTGGGRLEGGGAADAAHQVHVVHGAEADVVREDGGAHHVVVPVHGVGAVEQRDAEAAPGRGPAEAHDHLAPGGGRVGHGVAAPAGKDGADAVEADLVRGDAVLLHLRHLADLLAQRHALQQRACQRSGVCGGHVVAGR